MSVYIFLEYQLIGSERWEFIELLPEEYFDLDPDEKIEWNCVSMYNYDVEYLDIERKELSHTKLVEFHSFITDNEDASQSEKIIYPIE